MIRCSTLVRIDAGSSPPIIKPSPDRGRNRRGGPRACCRSLRLCSSALHRRPQRPGPSSIGSAAWIGARARARQRARARHEPVRRSRRGGAGGSPTGRSCGFYYRHTVADDREAHTDDPGEAVRLRPDDDRVASTPCAVTLSGFIDHPLSRTAPLRGTGWSAGRGATLVLQAATRPGAHASWKHPTAPDMPERQRRSTPPVGSRSGSTHPTAPAPVYYGRLRAIRTTTGVADREPTVDRSLHTAGVVPLRDALSSWQAGGRTCPGRRRAHLRRVRRCAPTQPASYDICDTTDVPGVRRVPATQCAVTTSRPRTTCRLAVATSNQVLTYHGHRRSSLSSARPTAAGRSSGGEPYLVSQRDPYDTAAASGDPYVSMSKKVTSHDPSRPTSGWRS